MPEAATGIGCIGSGMDTRIAGKTIGRFQLVRILGEGAQGTVYLARDAHLDREVAIKTLNLAPADRAATARRLSQEARTVSKLNHPNIVALYDAGDLEGAPYLVFEYVPGKTLADLLQRDAPLRRDRAVAIAIEILEGVAHAHGILHRDLKPGNVIFDAAGRARIADFGISTRLTARDTETFAATPLYVAPEYVERGEYLPQSDLYGVAAMLYQMLTGKAAVQGSTVKQVLEQVVRGETPPPSRHNGEVDEKLDALVLRALAKRPELRFASARELADALQAYLAPELPAEPPASANQSTIEFLLWRMRVKSEFPALSETIRTINRIAASDRESAGALARVILKDFALTNRLLKLVNAATFGQYGKVSTISRAVVIVGFEAVRSMAVTLLFLDHLQNRAQAGSLKEDVIGSLLSGLLAKHIAGSEDVRDSEEAFICAVYQNLGRLLAAYYFYEESQEIERLMAGRSLSEDQAASQVLGVSYEQLGIEIARTWNFPESILFSMRRIAPGKVPPAKTADDRIRTIANLADELRGITTGQTDKEHNRRLKELSGRFANGMHLDAGRLAQITRSAVQELASEASIFNIDLRNSDVLRQAHSWLAQAGSGIAKADVEDDGRDVLAESDLEKTLVKDEAAATAATPPAVDGKPANAAAILTAGIQDITNTLVSEYKLNDLLNIIIETIYRGMGFARVLIAIRDARSGVINGRFALGEDSDSLLRHFSFPLQGGPDLFRLSVSQGRDILISDARAEKLRAQLPDWYRSHVRATAFVLFPIVVGKSPVGLFYADKLNADPLSIERDEANLLVTLRNQAVLAFKQASVAR